MTKKINRLMVMAGGTGGHVFSGLAVSHYLIAKGWKVRWLGTINRIESILVPKHGINIDYIRIDGMRGKSLKVQLMAPVYVWRAGHESLQIMRAWKPHVVLGMGGYVSGPGGLAAWFEGIPVILHEQNSIAGLTNRFLSKIAYKVLQAFPGALPHAKVVGNPLRDAVLALPEPKQRFLKRSGPIRVLVLGGSQGAFVLNHIMPAVAVRLAGKFTFWHQVGNGALDEVKKAYIAASKTQSKVVKFIEDIASAYAWADVVVCRSGALTISEIATVGLPSVLVPFIHKDHHQYWNARLLEKIGAAKIVEQKIFTEKLVSDVLRNWNRETLLAMAQHARRAATPNATKRIAQEIITAAQH